MLLGGVERSVGEKSSAGSGCVVISCIEYMCWVLGSGDYGDLKWVEERLFRMSWWGVSSGNRVVVRAGFIQGLLRLTSSSTIIFIGRFNLFNLIFSPSFEIGGPGRCLPSSLSCLSLGCCYICQL